MNIFHGPEPIIIKPTWLAEDDQGNPTGVESRQYRATLEVGADETWFPGKSDETYDVIEDDVTGAEL